MVKMVFELFHLLHKMPCGLFLQRFYSEIYIEFYLDMDDGLLCCVCFICMHSFIDGPKIPFSLFTPTVLQWDPLKIHSKILCVNLIPETCKDGTKWTQKGQFLHSSLMNAEDFNVVKVEQN